MVDLKPDVAQSVSMEFLEPGWHQIHGVPDGGAQVDLGGVVPVRDAGGEDGHDHRPGTTRPERP